MDPQMRKALKDTLDALERLLAMFRVERIIHLVMGIVAMLLLFYAIALLLRGQHLGTELLASLFGSSGLIVVSSARITYFFNKAFNLVEHVVRVLIQSGGAQ